MEFRNDGKFIELDREEWRDTTFDESRQGLEAPVKVDAPKIEQPDRNTLSYSTSIALSFHQNAEDFSHVASTKLKSAQKSDHNLSYSTQTDFIFGTKPGFSKDFSTTPGVSFNAKFTEVTASALDLIAMHTEGQGFPRYIPKAYAQDLAENFIFMRPGMTSVDVVNELRKKAGLEPLQNVSFDETYEERKKREYNEAQWNMLARVNDDIMRHRAYEETREAKFLADEMSAYVVNRVSPIAKDFLNSAASVSLPKEDAFHELEISAGKKRNSANLKAGVPPVQPVRPAVSANQAYTKSAAEHFRDHKIEDRHDHIVKTIKLQPNGLLDPVTLDALIIAAVTHKRFEMLEVRVNGVTNQKLALQFHQRMEDMYRSSDHPLPKDLNPKVVMSPLTAAANKNFKEEPAGFFKRVASALSRAPQPVAQPVPQPA